MQLQEERELFQHQKENFEKERQKLMEAAHQLDGEVNSTLNGDHSFIYHFLHFAFQKQAIKDVMSTLENPLNSTQEG